MRVLFIQVALPFIVFCAPFCCPFLADKRPAAGAIVAVVQVDFSPACTPGPSGFASSPRSGRTMPASGGFLLTRSAGISLSSRSTSASTGGRPHTATVFAAGLLKGIRGCGAAFSPAHRWQFRPDEWREAPRLINRLASGSVVVCIGQPVAVPTVRSLAVSVTATSSPSGPFAAARFATLRPSGS